MTYSIHTVHIYHRGVLAETQLDHNTAEHQ